MHEFQSSWRYRDQALISIYPSYTLSCQVARQSSDTYCVNITICILYQKGSSSISFFALSDRICILHGTYSGDLKVQTKHIILGLMRSDTYEIMPDTTDENGSNFSPFSFRIGWMLNVWRVDVMVISNDACAR